MHNPRPAALLLVAVLVFAVFTLPAGAWGEEGHRYINRVAVSHITADVPPFFTGAAARLEFLGPEPDRWRDTKELFSALREVNGPDHFVDTGRTSRIAGACRVMRGGLRYRRSGD